MVYIRRATTTLTPTTTKSKAIVKKDQLQYCDWYNKSAALLLLKSDNDIVLNYTIDGCCLHRS
jgi:hypothetical protein